MTNRQQRAKLRKTRKITAELDRLAARNLEEIRYDQIDLLTKHIDDLDRAARQIEGFGSSSLYRWANRLYGQAIRRRRDFVDAADFLTWT